MKYLIKFENYNYNDLIFTDTPNKLYPPDYRFKVDDYVVCTTDKYRTVYKIILVNKDITNSFGGQYGIKAIANKGEKWASDSELELATEAEIDAIKYNL